MSEKIKNYKFDDYWLSGHREPLFYEELTKYFVIDPKSGKAECIKNFGLYAAGTTYNLHAVEKGFII